MNGLLSPKYTLNTGGHAPTYQERKPRSWTTLYHSDYLAVNTVSYPIWYNNRLHFDLWEAGEAMSGTAKVSFINLVSAKVVFTVTASVWPSWGSLWMNGVKLYDFDFRLGGGVVSQAIDVTDMIVLGNNEFMFKANKVAWFGWGDYVVTVDLVIEAETSSVEPPPPWQVWPAWWPFAAAGAGMAVVGGVILLKRRK